MMTQAPDAGGNPAPALQFPCDAVLLLPQRPPMQLIDTALSADDSATESRTAIRADNLLLNENGRFPALGLIEVMAQTVGIFAGRMRILAGDKPREGLLLGTRRMLLNAPSFPVGSRLHCRVEKTFESDDGLWQFDCRVTLERDEGSEPAGSAMLTVFNPPPGYFDEDEPSAAAKIIR